jgi:hypothetical protein
LVVRRCLEELAEQLFAGEGHVGPRPVQVGQYLDQDFVRQWALPPATEGAHPHAPIRIGEQPRPGLRCHVAVFDQCLPDVP